jgi:abhydrolase domain-containing protein 12
VLTIDYRGFGHSTGSPTEAGLIADGTALVNWVIHVARIPPERIVLLGQSLGTAVSSAVALNFVDPYHELIPQSNDDPSPLLDSQSRIAKPTAFAGVILVAPFSSLPSLLLTYRLGGLVPLLLPLRPFPVVGTALTSRMTDKWPSAKRLAAYYRAFESNPDLLKSVVGHDGQTEKRDMGMLQIIHAKTDMDISYHQTEMICAEIFGDDTASEYVAGEGDLLLDVKEQDRPRVRVQIVEHGGKLLYSSNGTSHAECYTDNDPQVTTAS